MIVRRMECLKWDGQATRGECDRRRWGRVGLRTEREKGGDGAGPWAESSGLALGGCRSLQQQQV